VSEVLHNAAVLGIRNPSTAETVHPTSAAVAFQSVLARGDDFDADLADSVARRKLHRRLYTLVFAFDLAYTYIPAGSRYNDSFVFVFEWPVSSA